MEDTSPKENVNQDCRSDLEEPAFLRRSSSLQRERSNTQPNSGNHDKEAFLTGRTAAFEDGEKGKLRTGAAAIRYENIETSFEECLQQKEALEGVQQAVEGDEDLELEFSPRNSTTIRNSSPQKLMKAGHHSRQLTSTARPPPLISPTSYNYTPSLFSGLFSQQQESRMAMPIFEYPRTGQGNFGDESIIEEESKLGITGISNQEGLRQNDSELRNVEDLIQKQYLNLQESHAQIRQQFEDIFALKRDNRLNQSNLSMARESDDTEILLSQLQGDEHSRLMSPSCTSQIINPGYFQFPTSFPEIDPGVLVQVKEELYVQLLDQHKAYMRVLRYAHGLIKQVKEQKQVSSSLRLELAVKVKEAEELKLHSQFLEEDLDSQRNQYEILQAEAEETATEKEALSERVKVLSLRLEKNLDQVEMMRQISQEQNFEVIRKEQKLQEQTSQTEMKNKNRIFSLEKDLRDARISIAKLEGELCEAQETTVSYVKTIKCLEAELKVMEAHLEEALQENHDLKEETSRKGSAIVEMDTLCVQLQNQVNALKVRLLEIQEQAEQTPSVLKNCPGEESSFKVGEAERTYNNSLQDLMSSGGFRRGSKAPTPELLQSSVALLRESEHSGSQLNLLTKSASRQKRSREFFDLNPANGGSFLNPATPSSSTQAAQNKLFKKSLLRKIPIYPTTKLSGGGNSQNSHKIFNSSTDLKMNQPDYEKLHLLSQANEDLVILSATQLPANGGSISLSASELQKYPEHGSMLRPSATDADHSSFKMALAKQRRGREPQVIDSYPGSGGSYRQTFGVEHHKFLGTFVNPPSSSDQQVNLGSPPHARRESPNGQWSTIATCFGSSMTEADPEDLRASLLFQILMSEGAKSRQRLSVPKYNSLDMITSPNKLVKHDLNTTTAHNPLSRLTDEDLGTQVDRCKSEKTILRSSSPVLGMDISKSVILQSPIRQFKLASPELQARLSLGKGTASVSFDPSSNRASPVEATEEQEQNAVQRVGLKQEPPKHQAEKLGWISRQPSYLKQYANSRKQSQQSLPPRPRRDSSSKQVPHGNEESSRFIGSVISAPKHQANQGPPSSAAPPESAKHPSSPTSQDQQFFNTCLAMFAKGEMSEADKMYADAASQSIPPASYPQWIQQTLLQKQLSLRLDLLEEGRSIGHEQALQSQYPDLRSKLSPIKSEGPQSKMSSRFQESSSFQQSLTPRLPFQEEERKKVVAERLEKLGIGKLGLSMISQSRTSPSKLSLLEHHHQHSDRFTSSIGIQPQQVERRLAELKLMELKQSELSSNLKLTEVPTSSRKKEEQKRGEPKSRPRGGISSQVSVTSNGLTSELQPEPLLSFRGSEASDYRSKHGEQQRERLNEKPSAEKSSEVISHEHQSRWGRLKAKIFGTTAKQPLQQSQIQSQSMAPPPKKNSYKSLAPASARVSPKAAAAMQSSAVRALAAYHSRHQSKDLLGSGSQISRRRSNFNELKSSHLADQSSSSRPRDHLKNEHLPSYASSVLEKSEQRVSGSRPRDYKFSGRGWIVVNK